MRIIAGTHRGRRLIGPPDAHTTRPITDRVKTMLFDRLASADRLDGARVLDLFAGTGSMGIECLSRGAESVTFVEHDRRVLDRLRSNLDAIGCADACRVLPLDALAASSAQRPPEAGYTLVFDDPPYALLGEEQGTARLRRQIERLASACAPDALLILRTPSRAEIGAIVGWSGPRSRTIGTMSLHEYRRETDPTEAAPSQA